MNAETPGFSMILWVLGGAVAGCGALCYAEVGLLIPKSGGEYPIVYDTYGHVPAFLFAWASSTIIRPCGFAICCATFSKYLLSVLRLCDDQIFAERLLSVWVRVLNRQVNAYYQYEHPTCSHTVCHTVSGIPV